MPLNIFVNILIGHHMLFKAFFNFIMKKRDNVTHCKLNL
jgi:hypothetical protein